MSYINILDIVYPVGCIYTSMSETSPAELFGGIWEQITDVFLRAGNNTETGGHEEISHKHDAGRLNAAISPKTEGIFYQMNWNNSYTAHWKVNNYGLGSNSSPMGESVPVIGETGTTNISILPPYQSVYTWKRIK